MVNLPDNIIDIQEEEEYFNLLVYADSGSGKTVFGGSDDNVLFIAPEDNGTLSSKRMGSTAKKWKINSWPDVHAAFEWLYAIHVSGEQIPFNWIVIDSLTELQSMCMRQVLTEAKAENPARDADTPQIQDWQPYYLRFERMVKAFNALPVNVLYTALEQTTAEDDEGDCQTLPMLQGKGEQYSKKVSSWMTSFGRMTVIRKKTDKIDEDTGKAIFDDIRVIQWRGSKTVMAKDRTMSLEPRTVNKSLKDIRGLVENSQQSPPPPKKTSSKLKTRNPANTPCDAADIMDSVPQVQDIQSVDLLSVGEEN